VEIIVDIWQQYATCIDRPLPKDIQ